jgi:hypothetical protein
MINHEISMMLKKKIWQNTVKLKKNLRLRGLTLAKIIQ